MQTSSAARGAIKYAHRVARALLSVAKTIKMPKAKDKRKSSSSGPALSFADDEEEGEAFVEKKKKKKPAPRPMAPVDTPLETPGALGTGAGVYSAEMLQKLRGEQSFRARPVEEDDSPAVPGDGLPDAEAIGRARAARASARAGGEDDEEAAAGNNDLFIPLERESNTERPSRLVTEEQADEEEDGATFADQGGDRLRFGQPMEGVTAGGRKAGGGGFASGRADGRGGGGGGGRRGTGGG